MAQVLSDSQQIAARRSKGKRFFNKDWKELLQAAIYYLADAKNKMEVKICCENNVLKIEQEPYKFLTTSSYIEPDIAINAYKEYTGAFPTELFIHGRTQFTDEEWAGFNKAIHACQNTNLVGITINETDGFRLYKDTYGQKCKYGILRGMALQIDQNNGYLWTKGYIPRIETSNHLEVARPLKITVSRGDCDIDMVMKDILCLTKLNYNACIYGYGLPVALRFSDKIGNILTALKDVHWPARQFKYYI